MQTKEPITREPKAAYHTSTNNREQRMREALGKIVSEASSWAGSSPDWVGFEAISDLARTALEE